MQRLPWLTFDNLNSEGLENIYMNACLHIKDDSVASDGSGTALYITVTNLTNLGGSILTVADLLAATTQWSYMFTGGVEKGGVLYNTGTSYVPGDTVSTVDATLLSPMNSEMRTYTCQTSTSGAWDKTKWSDLEGSEENTTWAVP